MKARPISIAALSFIVLTVFTVGTASATTLEIAGATQNSEVKISASLAAGSTLILGPTSASLSNTCTSSAVSGNTAAPFTGSKVTGPVTTLSFSQCHQEPVVVDSKGSLYVEWTANTTGNLFWEEAVVTFPTTANPTTPLKCVTGAGTKVGTVHGVASGNATITINGVISCGFLLPTAHLTGTYTVTSPSGLGISQ